MINRTIEMYLRCFTSSYPRQWIKWLSWVEYCYNTSFHSATKHAPFEVVYGRPPPSLLSYVPGSTKNGTVEDTLLARDAMLKEVRSPDPEDRSPKVRIKRQLQSSSTEAAASRQKLVISKFFLSFLFFLSYSLCMLLLVS